MNISNKLIRNVLRIMAWSILLVVCVSRLLIPYAQSKPLYLDTNDGYVVAVCLGLLLSIEGIKAAVNKFLTKKM